MRCFKNVRRTLFAALAFATLYVPQVSATPLDFNFSYTGAGVSASGVFTTNGMLSGGYYLVTNISGTRNGIAISSLAAPGSLGGNDNKLAPNVAYVDTAGITYNTAAGLSANLYTNGASSGCVGTVEGTNLTSSCVSLSIQAVPVDLPEPSSLALGTLMLGVTAVMKRRRRGGATGLSST